MRRCIYLPVGMEGSSHTPNRIDAGDLDGLPSFEEVGLFADRFQIEREAGLGGMGIVYRAIDRRTEQGVALKVLRKTDPTALRRFEMEAAALEVLDHPSIVRYLAHGYSEEGEPYLAMEWIEGESLHVRLGRLLAEGKHASFRDTIALGHALADALAAAHAQGIVHRDVKPSNILLAGGHLHEPKLADFGIVRADTSTPMTASGVVMGTVGYMAPEQARGESDLDGRADLFSLGCVLYRCLTNTDVFEGCGAVMVLAKMLLHDAPRVSARRADVSPDLDDLVARLLAKDRAERPASAAVVRDELARIAASLGDGTLVPAVSVARRKAAPHGSRIRPMAWLGVAASVLLAGLISPDAAIRSPLPAPPHAPPIGIPVLAQSVSPTCAPAAIDAYREGLQALRSTSWERAHALFEKATTADPSCPEPYVQQLITGEGVRGAQQQRILLARAAVFRDVLNERNKLLLDAWTVLIAAEVPRHEEAWRILDDAARRFPNDAEILVLSAIRTLSVAPNRAELEAALERSRTAAAIDPGYADALQARSRLAGRLALYDEELEALDQCIAISPGAVDCMSDRTFALRRRGRCSEAVAQAKEQIAWQPEDSASYRQLALSLAAQRAPRETVLEALRLRWERLPAAKRERWRLLESARLAIWGGDFEGAQRVAGELERHIRQSPSSDFLWRAALISVSIALETGDDARAARLAEQGMQRKEIWLREEPGNATYSLQEPQMLAAQLRGGRMTPAQWRQAADAWEQANLKQIDPFERWGLRWGPAVGSGVDVREALQKTPGTDIRSSARSTFINSDIGVLEAYEGWMRLEAGETAEAAPLLQAAANSCQSFDFPFHNVRAHLWLGRAKEKNGDVAGACNEYRGVLDQWGAAKPPSVTAREAKQRSLALGCARPPAR